LALAVASGYLVFAVRSAIQSETLRIPTKRDVIVLEQAALSPWLWWLWWLLLAALGLAAVAATARCLLVVVKRLRCRPSV
jgi:hypothetical protein